MLYVIECLNGHLGSHVAHYYLLFCLDLFTALTLGFQSLETLHKSTSTHKVSNR